MIWWRRLARRWAWAAGGAAAALIALRAPAVGADVRVALADGLRLPWLGVAAAAEAVCVAGLVMTQRQLLAAAGARLPVRAVAAAVFASTGLARLLPAGPAAAAAWQAGQYRRRDPASGTAGVWAVLAGGVASTVAALAVLAAGAAAARWWLLPAAPRRSPRSPPRPWPRAGPTRRPGGWPVTLAGHGGAGGWLPAWPGWPATGSGHAGAPAGEPGAAACHPAPPVTGSSSSSASDHVGTRRRQDGPRHRDAQPAGGGP